MTGKLTKKPDFSNLGPNRYRITACKKRRIDLCTSGCAGRLSRSATCFFSPQAVGAFSCPRRAGFSCPLSPGGLVLCLDTKNQKSRLGGTCCCPLPSIRRVFQPPLPANASLRSLNPLTRVRTFGGWISGWDDRLPAAAIRRLGRSCSDGISVRLRAYLRQAGTNPPYTLKCRLGNSAACRLRH